MSSKPVKKTTGFARRTAGYMEKYTAECVAGRYNPAKHIAELRAEARALAAANQTQESNKSGQKLQTLSLKEIFHDAFYKAGGALDMAVGILKKTSVEGQEGALLRRDVRGVPSSPIVLTGFIDSVAAFIGKYKTRLEPEGMAVDDIIGDLEDNSDAVDAADVSQEGAKSVRGASTRTVVQMATDLYDKAYGCLIAAVGAVGKDTLIGQEGLAIRASLDTAPDEDEEEPPAPPPAPPAQPTQPGA